MRAHRVQAEEWVYVPREDRALPPAEQTRVRLRPMSEAWKARAADDIAVRESDGAVRLRTAQLALEIAREHVVRVDNFPAGGKALAWPEGGTDAEKDAYLARMGTAAVTEIGHACWDMCSLDAPPDTGAPPLGESSP